MESVILMNKVECNTIGFRKENKKMNGTLSYDHIYSREHFKEMYFFEARFSEQNFS